MMYPSSPRSGSDAQTITVSPPGAFPGWEIEHEVYFTINTFTWRLTLVIYVRRMIQTGDSSLSLYQSEDM